MIGSLGERVMREVTPFLNLGWSRCYDDISMVILMILLCFAITCVERFGMVEV